jgi:hypothetical protein
MKRMNRDADLRATRREIKYIAGVLNYMIDNQKKLNKAYEKQEIERYKEIGEENLKYWIDIKEKILHNHNFLQALTPPELSNLLLVVVRFFSGVYLDPY